MMHKFLFLLIVPLIGLGQSKLDDVDQLFHNKDYANAESLLTNYLKEHPQDLKAIELLGDAYGYQEQWDAAISKYKMLVQANQTNANYYYKYGGALGMKALTVNKVRALGIIGDVKKAFLTAAELDPNHIETRWALVELYMQLPGILGGNTDKALQYANQLEQLSKVDGYLSKGYIYEYNDQPDLAETYYKKAITEGGSLTCFDKLTKLYETKNQPEKAIQNIEEAQKIYQRNALHYQIGKVAAEYNIELQKGEACLQTYLKNYSSRDGVPKAWAHYRLAQIYLHKNNKDQALKHIDLALAELPKIKPFVQEKEKILSM